MQGLLIESFFYKNESTWIHNLNPIFDNILGVGSGPWSGPTWRDYKELQVGRYLESSAFWSFWHDADLKECTLDLEESRTTSGLNDDQEGIDVLSCRRFCRVHLPLTI